MRFLGVGESNDLAAMYHGLARRGHEVKVFVQEEASRDVHSGMLHFTLFRTTPTHCLGNHL